MRNGKIILLLLATLLLNGCAVMSKADCETANWQRIGYELGLDGEPDMQAAWEKRADVCAGHGFTTDFDSYKTGYADGRIDHCTQENAVRLGARGNTRSIDFGLCPDQDYPGFLVAWEAGRTLFEFRSAAQMERNELDRLIQHRDRSYYERREIRQRLQSGELTKQQEQNLRYRLRYIDREMYNMDSRIRYAESRLRKRLRAAEEYEDILSLEYGDDWR